MQCMQLCFPENHPALAYHYMNIGIFNARLEKNDEAKSFLSQARQKLIFSLGHDHSMTRQCIEWLEKCSNN